VDDIEREGKAETDDLKSVREFADLGKDLREAKTDAEQIGRETNTVLREQPTSAAADAKKPIRPSQRSEAAAAADGATVPGIEQAAAATQSTPEPKPAPKPAQKPEEPASSTFDPFKKPAPKKGPVLIPRESVSSEGDERL